MPTLVRRRLIGHAEKGSVVTVLCGISSQHRQRISMVIVNKVDVAAAVRDVQRLLITMLSINILAVVGRSRQATAVLYV